MSEKMRSEFEAAYAKSFPDAYAKAMAGDAKAHGDLTMAWWGYRTATPKAYGDGWIAAMTWGKKDE